MLGRETVRPVRRSNGEMDRTSSLYCQPREGKKESRSRWPSRSRGTFGGVISNLLTHGLPDRSTTARRRLNSCALAWPEARMPATVKLLQSGTVPWVGIRS